MGLGQELKGLSRGWRILLAVAAVLVMVVAAFTVVQVVAVGLATYENTLRRVTAQDIDAITAPLGRLGRLWQADGQVARLRARLAEDAQRLEAALNRGSNAKGRSQVDQALVRLRQTLIETDALTRLLEDEKTVGAQATKELRASVDIVTKKLREPVASDPTASAFLSGVLKLLQAAVWPLTICLLVLYVVISRIKISEMFRGFKSFEVGPTGAKLVLAESEKVKADTEDRFERFRKDARLKYDLWVQRNAVVESLRGAKDGVLQALRQAKKSGDDIEYRCTLYVKDIVFEHTLCQLVNYLPAGGGAGRIFSIRFGLIGKVWRSRKPESQGNIPPDPDVLVKEWGMTIEEAKHARNRPSFLCVPIDDAAKRQVAMFYMDSLDPNAFRSLNDPALFDLVRQQCKENGLTDTVAKLRDDLGGSALLISIHDT